MDDDDDRGPMYWTRRAVESNQSFWDSFPNDVRSIDVFLAIGVGAALALATA